jgi:hypothetical protein
MSRRWHKTGASIDTGKAPRHEKAAFNAANWGQGQLGSEL